VTGILLNGTRCIVQGREHILIESRSRPGQHHSLELVDEGKGFLEEACSCEGFQFRRQCWHTRLLRDWRLGKLDARLDLDAA